MQTPCNLMYSNSLKNLFLKLNSKKGLNENIHREFKTYAVDDLNTLGLTEIQ